MGTETATVALGVVVARLASGKSLPAEATPKEHRTTTQTLLRAFSNYTLIIHHSRLGREVQPTRLTTRQREILQRLGFNTPAHILSRQLPRAP